MKSRRARRLVALFLRGTASSRHLTLQLRLVIRRPNPHANAERAVGTLARDYTRVRGSRATSTPTCFRTQTA